MSEFADFIIDQLHSLSPIHTKQMFGVEALFRHGKMFAFVADNELYVKADSNTQELFIKENCDKFYYFTRKNGIQKRVALNYYKIPETALENDEELYYWVRLGIKSANT